MWVRIISYRSRYLFTGKISTAAGKAARTGTDYCPFAEGALQSGDGGATACGDSKQNALSVLQKSSEVSPGSAVSNFLTLVNGL